MSILLLAQDGKLSLSDDIRKYVPEIPKYEEPITIQQLINHTSGLKDWGSIGELSGWPRTTRVYTQELALQIMSRQKSTNFPPGSEYSYSNANYSLLHTIVARVSGQTLAEFTTARLLQLHDQYAVRDISVKCCDRAVAYTNRGRSSAEMPFENI